MIAGKRYAYMAAPWNAPLSLGVQAPIEFNGYVINDRYQADRIRITSITGLDGPDITDTREVVPGDEGEFAYQGLYRGRTFVLTGAIQAGSLATCTSMARDLRAAYAPLVEAPMKFRWFDIYDGFTDPLTYQNYTTIIGSSSTWTAIPISGGFLRWATTSPLLVTRSADNRLWGDVQVTERLIVGGQEDNTQMGVVLAVTDDNDYLVAKLVNGTTPNIEVQTIVGGTAHTIATTSATVLTQGQPVWVRGRREGDMVTAELWLTQPVDTAIPAYTAQGWLSGADADAFGDAVLSDVGMYGDAAGTTWSVTDFWIDSLYPGDISFMAKSITKPSIQDAQQKMTTFERQIQLTVRASWPYAQSATQRRMTTLVPSAGNTTQLGFSNPLTNPLSALTIIPGTVGLENDILYVQNRGTAPERPILVVFGATSDFALINLTNGMQVQWNGTVSDGGYLVFDCQNRTLVDSTGANQKAGLTLSDPRWILLEPGWNDLYFVGSGYSANTKVLGFLRDRYI